MVKNSIKFEVVDLLEDLNCEIVGINIELNNNSKLYIFSYYNPPTVTLEKIVFDRIEEKYDKYLICGDLNARSIALGGVGNNKNGEILEKKQ